MTKKKVDGRPTRFVGMNQIVSYNVTYWRQARQITQTELGERLATITGRTWTKANVSALERTWDGHRVRRFDAELLFALARALEVPLTGLFLPPEDAEVDVEYAISPEGVDDDLPANDRIVFMPNTGELLSYLYASTRWKRGDEVYEAYHERMMKSIREHFGDVAVAKFSGPQKEKNIAHLDTQLNDVSRRRAVLREMLEELEEKEDRFRKFRDSARFEWEMHLRYLWSLHRQDGKSVAEIADEINETGPAVADMLAQAASLFAKTDQRNSVGVLHAEGKSVEEIASTLNLSLKAVRAYLNEAGIRR